MLNRARPVSFEGSPTRPRGTRASETRSSAAHAPGQLRTFQGKTASRSARISPAWDMNATSIAQTIKHV